MDDTFRVQRSMLIVTDEQCKTVRELLNNLDQARSTPGSALEPKPLTKEQKDYLSTMLTTLDPDKLLTGFPLGSGFANIVDWSGDDAERDKVFKLFFEIDDPINHEEEDILKMIKLIGLALLAAAITYLSVPALLWVYLTASGFQDVQASPLVGLLVIPLVVTVIGMWALVIGNYRQFNKEKSNG